jgi:hypothetical protein
MAFTCQSTLKNKKRVQYDRQLPYDPGFGEQNYSSDRELVLSNCHTATSTVY